MVGNTGTYLDSPFHRYADGADLAALPLESCAELPAVLARFAGSGARAVDAGALAALDVSGGRSCCTPEGMPPGAAPTTPPRPRT